MNSRLKIFLILLSVVSVVGVLFVYIGSNFKLIDFVANTMEPTLKNNRKHLVKKIRNDKSVLTPDQVVAFKVIADELPYSEEVSHLGRIIAIENDEVEIRDGVVLRNGKMLEEPYLHENSLKIGSVQKQKIPEGSVFIMYDNRNTVPPITRLISIKGIEGVLVK